jgi:hypothetical protein
MTDLTPRFFGELKVLKKLKSMVKEIRGWDQAVGKSIPDYHIKV